MQQPQKQKQAVCSSVHSEELEEDALPLLYALICLASDNFTADGQQQQQTATATATAKAKATAAANLLEPLGAWPAWAP